MCVPVTKLGPSHQFPADAVAVAGILSWLVESLHARVSLNVLARIPLVHVTPVPEPL